MRRTRIHVLRRNEVFQPVWVKIAPARLNAVAFQPVTKYLNNYLIRHNFANLFEVLTMEISCGTVLYSKVNGIIHYVLIQAYDDGYCGFPKGHLEGEETEEETALRETWEEVSVKGKIEDGFRKETLYTLPNGNAVNETPYAGPRPWHMEFSYCSSSPSDSATDFPDGNNARRSTCISPNFFVRICMRFPRRDARLKAKFMQASLSYS